MQNINYFEKTLSKKFDSLENNKNHLSAKGHYNPQDFDFSYKSTLDRQKTYHDMFQKIRCYGFKGVTFPKREDIENYKTVSNADVESKFFNVYTADSKSLSSKGGTQLNGTKKSRMKDSDNYQYPVCWDTCQFC